MKLSKASDLVARHAQEVMLPENLLVVVRSLLEQFLDQLEVRVGAACGNGGSLISFRQSGHKRLLAAPGPYLVKKQVLQDPVQPGLSLVTVQLREQTEMD
jgi:hypothetical protein